MNNNDSEYDDYGTLDHDQPNKFATNTDADTYADPYADTYADADDSITFNITRHLNSCNNMIEVGSTNLRKPLEGEPVLSLWGTLTGLDITYPTKGVSHVYASCLLRTWITAILRYMPESGMNNTDVVKKCSPRFTITIAPYIKEYHLVSYLDRGNLPFNTIQQQIRRVKEYFNDLENLLPILKNITFVDENNKESLKIIIDRLTIILNNKKNIFIEGPENYKGIYDDNAVIDYQLYDEDIETSPDQQGGGWGLSGIFNYFTGKKDEPKDSSLIDYEDRDDKYNNDEYKTPKYIPNLNKPFTQPVRPQVTSPVRSPVRPQVRSPVRPQVRSPVKQPVTMEQYIKTQIEAINIDDNESNTNVSGLCKNINNKNEDGGEFTLSDDPIDITLQNLPPEYNRNYGTDGIFLFIRWFFKNESNNEKDIYIVSHSDVMQQTLTRICGIIKGQKYKKSTLVDCEQKIKCVQHQNMWDLKLNASLYNENTISLNNVNIKGGINRVNKTIIDRSKEITCNASIGVFGRKLGKQPTKSSFSSFFGRMLGKSTTKGGEKLKNYKITCVKKHKINKSKNRKQKMIKQKMIKQKSDKTKTRKIRKQKTIKQKK